MSVYPKIKKLLEILKKTKLNEISFDNIEFLIEREVKQEADKFVQWFSNSNTVVENIKRDNFRVVLKKNNVTYNDVCLILQALNEKTKRTKDTTIKKNFSKL